MATTEEEAERKAPLFLRAARGERVERTPVWAMRQAGRYLPEYNATRARAGSFFGLCQNPELVAEVTLQPLLRFDLDAAIIFSDILVVPQALGMEVIMVEKTGPTLPHPLRFPSPSSSTSPSPSPSPSSPSPSPSFPSPSSISSDESNPLNRLKYPVNVEEELGYVYEAVRLTKSKLVERNIPLIGFSGAPWTLMCYMIEGAGSKTFSEAKKWLYRHREASHQLLHILSEVIADHLAAQAAAGADALMVFDSWAGELSPDAFAEFGLPYLQRIAAKLRARFPAGPHRLPLIVFPKGANHALELLVSHTVYDVIGLDWTIDPSLARQRADSAAASSSSSSPSSSSSSTTTTIEAASAEGSIAGEEIESGKSSRSVVLQGNLDPCVLYAEPATIQTETERMIARFGPQRLIANLGHGMHPSHKPEHLKVFVDTVHAASEALIQK